jgi:hypothetical protein
MCDDFYLLGIKMFCLVFFSIGIISIAIWIWKYFPDEWKKSAEDELLEKR